MPQPRTRHQISAFDALRVTILTGVRTGWVGIAYVHANLFDSRPGTDAPEKPILVAFSDGTSRWYRPQQVRVVSLDRAKFLAAGGLETDCAADVD